MCFITSRLYYFSKSEVTFEKQLRDIERTGTMRVEKIRIQKYRSIDDITLSFPKNKPLGAFWAK